MRDLDTVDGELRVLAGVRRVMKGDGVDPSQDVVDRLIDERIEIERNEIRVDHCGG